MSPRWQAVEVEAQRLVADLRTGRKTTFTTSSEQFAADVLARMHQILAGDLTPAHGSDDD
jgi:hypothetical protein